MDHPTGPKKAGVVNRWWQEVTVSRDCKVFSD